MWLSPLAQQFKDEDENVNDVIEMGQDAQPEPEPVPKTSRASASRCWTHFIASYISSLFFTLSPTENRWIDMFLLFHRINLQGHFLHLRKSWLSLVKWDEEIVEKCDETMNRIWIFDDGKKPRRSGGVDLRPSYQKSVLLSGKVREWLFCHRSHHRGFHYNSGLHTLPC